MSTEQSPISIITPPASTEGGANGTTARRTRRNWTPWEDQSLRNRIAQYGHARGSEGRWTEIAQGIPGRTAKDCRKRWFHSLDPSLRKGRWTEDEDRILLEAYSRLGPAWKQIADLIPGRKDDQCSKRYVDILGPLAKNRLSGWTPEEDQILRESVNDLGHRWAAVALKLPGRPPLTCRNRWRCLSKQAAAAKPTTAEQQTSPASVQPASDNDAGQSQSPPVSRLGDAPDAATTSSTNQADQGTIVVNDSASLIGGTGNMISSTNPFDYSAHVSLDGAWNAGPPVDSAHVTSLTSVPDLEDMPDADLHMVGGMEGWDLEPS